SANSIWSSLLRPRATARSTATPSEARSGGLFRTHALRSLLRSLEQMWQSRTELVDQHGLIGLGGDKVAHLDVTESADLFRDRRDADGEMVIVGREFGDNLVKRGFVVGDELALGAAFLRTAE